MLKTEEIKLPRLDVNSFKKIINAKIFEEIMKEAEFYAKHLRGQSIWHINSTAKGGGVAEMLPALNGYAQGLMIDFRWLVIEGKGEYFSITKRLHNGIHGSKGDGGELGERERKIYEEVLKENVPGLRKFIKAGDFVVLHDPQTAGLVDDIKKMGANVIWRSHIGQDDFNEYVNKSWDFLKKYLTNTDAFVFTRKSYAPKWVPKEKLNIIYPSIDPFSVKNQQMDNNVVKGILQHIGLVNFNDTNGFCCDFIRNDGRKSKVERKASIIREAIIQEQNSNIITQVSRWDRLKDMVGVLRGFVDHVLKNNLNYHLVLVGPDVSGVTDDPEGLDTYRECIQVWKSLPESKRLHVHLVCLPMDDLEENAAMVNAIQRYSQVIIQKSLYEGFGLTITEAMWKARPVIASKVGGIQDQIKDKDTGVLVDDPYNLRDFGHKLSDLLQNDQLKKDMGKRAYEQVLHDRIIIHHLLKYLRLLDMFQKVSLSA